MNRFFWRIVICLVPTLASLAVVAWAYNEYQNGRGGFIRGIDLAGGTTLVYEIDETKMTPEAQSAFKVEDLAASLKRRIDPADLYNVTIRPIPSTPPRVEIVLPTGGKHQADIEDMHWRETLADAANNFPVLKDGKPESAPYAQVSRIGDHRTALGDAIRTAQKAQIEAWVKETAEGKPWKDVLAKAAERYPDPAGKEDPYSAVPSGKTEELSARIMEAENRKIENWVSDKFDRQASKGKRMLTGDEVENIKNLVSRQGRLEFRILANAEDDAPAMAAATAYFDAKSAQGEKRRELLARLEQRAEPPPTPTDENGNSMFPVRLNNQEPDHSYSWVEIGKDYLHRLKLNSEALEANNMRVLDASGRAVVDVGQALATGMPFRLGENLIYARPITTWSRRSLKDRHQGKSREFFILVRDPAKGDEVTGDFLIKATQDRDERGRPAIAFVFNNEGGERFYNVTSRNRPSGTGPGAFHRYLAVIFDGQIDQAPSLNGSIRTNGQISGEFTQQEIDDRLRILRAGALPATLKKDPVSENSIGATLGADTIYWGTISVAGAFAAVMLFMVFYYRFAGLVACVALLANLLLTVAFMVAVQAAFTLPGLAGLVLMLGMAVDANVLIYERLREERERGATLSQALRNGYERALPTIIDTHLSSIFTAIVLYVVGNDQLKGFGISLTVGLLISLFTSLYMTRTIFEIWLAKGWLKELNFFNGLVKLIHARYWDFMSIRYYWFTGTIIATLLGAALFIYRADSDPAAGKATVLNIDFTGGTLYSGQLNEPLTLGELRTALHQDEAPLPDMSITQTFVSGDKDDSGKAGASRYFTLRTSEKDSEKVLKFISDQLGGKEGEKGKLKLVQLARFGVETGRGGATGARLDFTDENGDPAFASQAQVQRVLLGSKAFEDTRLSPSIFTIEHAMKRKLEWSDVLASATQAYPVTGAEKPYADVKDGDSAALAEAIYTKSVKPRLEAWVKDNAGPKADWKKVQQEAAQQFPLPAGPDGYSKVTDATALKSLLEKAERDAVTDWAKAASVTGDVEKGGHYSTLMVKLTEPVPPEDMKRILAAAADKFKNSPQPERLEVFDKQLAGNTQERALYAILASWGAILLYLWFRFGNWTFGAAAVMCLVHDLFFTLGVIAACHYIHAAFGTWFLGIQDFKIDLNTVAALLTLVGYSVNDTIVVFDRIREVRGKNPMLTPQMINDSVNQTLTRTILASATVMVVVLVLYTIGGEGVKLFAFVMIVGVVVGTYSSIYIASPLLLIFGEGRMSQAELSRATAAADRV